MKPWERQQVEITLDGASELVPPWVRFPEYTRWSLGWRMGQGETYEYAYRLWTADQGWDRAERVAFLRRFRPAPRTWEQHLRWFLTDRVHPQSPEPVELGLLEDDVGYGAWVMRHAPDYTPWTQHQDTASPAWMAGSASRPLAFFCRWATALRCAGELDPWLGTHPPQEDWRAFARALTGDRAPAEATPLGRGSDRVALEMAARGVAPPPWIFGLDAPGRAASVEGDLGYADAWIIVINNSIDDERSLRTYFEGWAPAPEPWRVQLQGWLMPHLQQPRRQ